MMYSCCHATERKPVSVLVISGQAGYTYSDLYLANQPAPSADAAKAVKVGGKVKVNASATFSDGTEHVSVCLYDDF